MNPLRKVVAPILVVAFLFTGVTGLLLLLEVESFLVKELHEMSAILFALSGVFHLTLNFRSLIFHFKQRVGLIAFVLTLLLLSGIALHLSGEGGRHRPQGPEVSEPSQP